MIARAVIRRAGSHRPRRADPPITPATTSRGRGGAERARGWGRGAGAPPARAGGRGGEGVGEQGVQLGRGVRAMRGLDPPLEVLEPHLVPRKRLAQRVDHFLPARRAGAGCGAHASVTLLSRVRTRSRFPIVRIRNPAEGVGHVARIVAYIRSGRADRAHRSVGRTMGTVRAMRACAKPPSTARRSYPNSRRQPARCRSRSRWSRPHPSTEASGSAAPDPGRACGRKPTRDHLPREAPGARLLGRAAAPKAPVGTPRTESGGEESLAAALRFSGMPQLANWTRFFSM